MTRQILACTIAILANVACDAALTPLLTFGGGDGWLAPGEGGITWLGTANNERGMSYNPTTGNLILPSRTGGSFVKVINGATGAEIGNLNPGAGYSGGTFVINAVDVAADGGIYVGNLSVNATTNFKVYRWSNEGAAASVAYDALSGLTRTGDSFAATGSGTGTVLAAAGSNNVTASNFAAFATTDGSSFTSTAYTSIAGTITTSNDYRLGLTFIDSDTLIGNQGANARITDFNGTIATVVSSIPVGVAQRPLDYAVIGGVPVIGIVDTGSSLVQVFDISTPTSPILLESANLTTSFTANTNATGGVAWANISGSSATLYAMNTNNGIQAFSFVIPEPSSMVLLLTACVAILARRKQS